MSKIALITGITGQDGAYLARLLLSKDYKVHALRQPSALPDTMHIEHILPQINLHYGDMTDGSSIQRILNDVKPDEIYNLAAQSHVKISFDTPEYTMNVNGVGVVRMLDYIRIHAPHIKFFQASTSEMFGNAPAPQNETSSMYPRSPYAAAKKYAYDMVRIYREAYGVFASNGIMFNHESENRGEEFVTRKIARGVAKIAHGNSHVIELGNLEARRDWSHAEDIMAGAYAILQADKADDYILASNISYSVRDFVSEAFSVAGINVQWQGAGLEEKAVDAEKGQVLVRVNPAFFRPLEVENLQGDYSKAMGELSWQPRKNFKMIIQEMVEAELGYSTQDNIIRLQA